MQNNYLFVGDDVSSLKIYEIINKFFGRDYRGWMRAWYDINDDFAAWFPTITETDECPGGRYGGTRTCSNTLSPDRKTIIEIDHDVLKDPADDKPKYAKLRLVFARIDGSFEFLGVFQRTVIKEGTRTIKRHEQIADGINLQTFELYRKVDRT